MQHSCAVVNSPYKRKWWTNSGGPLVNLLWGAKTEKFRFCGNSLRKSVKSRETNREGELICRKAKMEICSVNINNSIWNVARKKCWVFCEMFNLSEMLKSEYPRRRIFAEFCRNHERGRNRGRITFILALSCSSFSLRVVACINKFLWTARIAYVSWRQSCGSVTYWYGSGT